MYVLLWQIFYIKCNDLINSINIFMDKVVEERFVKKFIKKENRERTLYELNSAKKRKQVIHRLIN